MPKLFEIHALPKPPKVSKNHLTAFLEKYSSRVPKLPGAVLDASMMVGIEVEVENIRDNLPLSGLFWEAKADNSLRNHGQEFVSYALSGESLHWALSELHHAMPESAVFSQRTSVHVHVDVQQQTPEEIARIGLTYLTVEKALYRWIGHNRDKNIFCFPLYDLPMVDTLFQRLSNLSRGNVQTAETRYSGLNFDPLFKFGTLEFRHMHGTRDMGRVLTWVNMLACIRRFALHISTEELIQRLLALNTNSEYRFHLSSIFGDLTREFDLSTVDDDVAHGVLSVKRAVLSNKWKMALMSAASVESPAATFLILNKGRPEENKMTITFAPPGNLIWGDNVVETVTQEDAQAPGAFVQPQREPPRRRVGGTALEQLINVAQEAQRNERNA